TREYGDANPSLDGNYSGAKNGETFVVTGSTTATETSPVGTYDVIPAVTGATLANYDVVPVNGTLTIESATLTITAPSPTREYGDANPSLDGNFSGAKNGETFVVTGSTTATETSPVGTYDVVPAVTGATLANYDVVPVNGTLTIESATLTITAPSPTREYGDANPSLDGNYSGAKNGETFVVTGSTTATETSPVGTYDVIPAVTGATLANYDVVPVNGTLTIESATLTITAPSPTREYGDANPSLDGGYSGAKNGETFVVTGSTTATETSPVGTYTVIPAVTGATLANYDVVPVNGTLTIESATLTITAPSPTREYGDANPSLDGGYSGAKNGETFVVTGSTVATTTSPIGTYDVIPAVTGATLANYDVVPVNGTLTVETATLTITADAKAREYGDPNPTFTGGYSGQKNGETFVVSFENTTTPTTPVGSYPIVPSVTGATLANYDVVAINGALTIGPATLEISADDATRVYGSANPAFTGSHGPTKNGESFDLDFSTVATPSSPVVVDGYPIVPNASGPTLSNYTVVPHEGTLMITKKDLIVTAENKSRSFGSPDPAFTATYSGFVLGQTASVLAGAPAFTTDATETSPIGSGYYIRPALGTLSATNYEFTAYVDGVLTITTATTTAATALVPSTIQYSDRTTATATITGANTAAQTAANLGGVVTFSLVDGSSVTTLGTATSYSIVSGKLTASAPFAIGKPRGVYAIRAAFVPTSTDITGSTAPDATLTVTRELAVLDYNGTTSFSANATTKAATLSLSASAIDPDDASPGRIQNATVDFLKDSPSGSVINSAAEDVEVGFVNTGDTINGIANAESFSYTLSNSEVADGGAIIEVYPVARGEYYTGAAAQPGVIAIVMPGADYVNGGGYMVIGNTNGTTTSAGTYAANAGSKMNFGFTMKYTQSGRNLKGKANIIFRRTESDGVVHTYQIKSNAVNSLTVTEVRNGTTVLGRRGVFNTKANLTDITDPLSPVSLGGNLDLTVDAYEAVATGESNSIGVSLRGSNNLLFGSRWVNNALARATLGGGSIKVRNTTSAAKPVVEETEAETGIARLEQNTPNPFAGRTTIGFELAETSHVTLTIVDAYGEIVARLVDEELPAGARSVEWESETEAGRKLPSGAYYYRLTARSMNGEEVVVTRQMILTR
ncbi:MAG TPA: MBG domain-containing protein, partial [Candidatus Kapabacteria bacterium]|nr:MBG domain-containing protein [Candidatus Kapabacteria bacterium]